MNRYKIRIIRQIAVFYLSFILMNFAFLWTISSLNGGTMSNAFILSLSTFFAYVKFTLDFDAKRDALNALDKDKEKSRESLFEELRKLKKK